MLDDFTSGPLSVFCLFLSGSLQTSSALPFLMLKYSPVLSLSLSWLSCQIQERGVNAGPAVQEGRQVRSTESIRAGKQKKQGYKENGAGRARGRTSGMERWMSRMAQGDRNANRGGFSIGVGMNHPHLSAARPQQAGSFFLSQTLGCF